MLNDYLTSYGDIKVIAINITYSDSLDAVESYIERLGYNFEFVLDQTGELSSMYDFKYIPFIVILDEEGVITYTGSAPSTALELKSLLE